MIFIKLLLEKLSFVSYIYNCAFERVENKICSKLAHKSLKTLENLLKLLLSSSFQHCCFTSMCKIRNGFKRKKDESGKILVFKETSYESSAIDANCNQGNNIIESNNASQTKITRIFFACQIYHCYVSRPSIITTLVFSMDLHIIYLLL